MLEGKRFLPETGIPILKIARKMVLLAVELPEPFLVPTIMEKSFTTLFMILLNVMESISLLMECPANLASKLADSKFTVFDTTSRYERSMPHSLPCNLHYKSPAPSSGGSAILPANIHNYLQIHSSRLLHTRPSTPPGCP